MPPIELQSVFPTAEDPSLAKYEAAVANLTAMFGQLGRDKVEEVLHLNAGRVEAAVDMLLAMTTTDTTDTAGLAAAPPVASPQAIRMLWCGWL